MPRLPIDYSKTIIYKLVHKDDLDDVNIYIGHTTDFTRRKSQHKNNCNSPISKEYNTKKYQFIRENGGWDEWVMLKIEDYPCKDIHEATLQERYWKRELDAKLNIQEPARTLKEYLEDNKEKKTEYKKQYYEVNKEKIVEKKKEHYEANKEKMTEQMKEYYENNKDKILEKTKEYRQNNREKLLKKSKEYYEDNKEKLLEYQKEKIKCEKCGREITRSSLSNHKKSLKCQNHGSQ